MIVSVAIYPNIESVRRLALIAKQMLGEDRLLVRWQKYLDNPVVMRGLPEEQLNRNYISALSDYPCRFTGRAGGRLAELVAAEPIEKIAEKNCRSAFLGAKGVHIDPLGNVFSGTCSGIIIGNLNRLSLEDVWKRFDPSQNEFIRTLFEYGPAGFLEKAVECGYKPLELYADKCHLCTHIRRFYFDAGIPRALR